MKIELAERNRVELKLEDDTPVMGGKTDHVFLNVSEVEFVGDVVAEVYEIHDDGTLHRVSSTTPGIGGPSMTITLVSDDSDTRTYVLRLMYVSLPGHIVQIHVGGQSAEIVIWEGAGFRLEERKAQWFVLDAGRDEDPSEEEPADDWYGFKRIGVAGPFPSRLFAQKQLLSFSTTGLLEALLQNGPDVEEWKSRAADSVTAGKLVPQSNFSNMIS